MPSPEASRRNLEKAKAHWRRPAPWRSERETRLIRRLAWQWRCNEGPRCSGRALARLLGVSHTYIQKLMREFARGISRRNRGDGLATFEQLRLELRYAQEETGKMRERGWLRYPSKSMLERKDKPSEVKPTGTLDCAPDFTAIHMRHLRMQAEQARRMGRRPRRWRPGLGRGPRP